MINERMAMAGCVIEQGEFNMIMPDQEIILRGRIQGGLASAYTGLGGIFIRDFVECHKFNNSSPQIETKPIFAAFSQRLYQVKSSGNKHKWHN